MAKLFDSYIVVDWSAASKPGTGNDSIWVGKISPDARFRPQFTAENPDTRIKAETFLRQTIDRLLARGERIFIGLDFPLGFPEGTSSALGLKGETPWQAMYAFLAKEMKDNSNNQNNRFPLAARMNRLISNGPFPFWGCPARDALTTLSVKKSRAHEKGDLEEFRLTERVLLEKKLARPQPVWKLAYAGAAGGQTLTGIPMLSRLKDSYSEMKLWPFETKFINMDEDNLKDTQIVVCEIYPSLLKVDTKPGEAKDLTQVRTVCKWLEKQDRDGCITSLFNGPNLNNYALKLALENEEGWIFGV